VCAAAAVVAVPASVALLSCIKEKLESDSLAAAMKGDIADAAWARFTTFDTGGRSWDGGEVVVVCAAEAHVLLRSDGFSDTRR
jgi:hypothetical protein